MKESSLHIALKNNYTLPGCVQEAWVDGYLIDVVQDGLLVEIQTKNFGKLKQKLSELLSNHKIKVVHPIGLEKWIVKLQPGHQTVISRRRSPLHRSWEYLFDELVRIPQIAAHPNFSLEVVLIREEELRINDGKGSWRRKGWTIFDRRLLEIYDTRIFASPLDYLSLLPPGLPKSFTVKDLSSELKVQSRLAYRMVYCLRVLNLLEVVGKRGRANEFGLVV